MGNDWIRKRGAAGWTSTARVVGWIATAALIGGACGGSRRAPDTAGTPPRGGAATPPPGRPDAPPVAVNAPGRFLDRVRFLADEQLGLDETALASGIVTVVRGRVLDRDHRPVAGADVAVVGREELGRAQTGSDGWFDLLASVAPRGDGSDPVVVVEASRDGYLPVQRRVDVTGPGFELADDMLLTRLDPAATTITFQRPVEIARGSEVRDADGPRRPVLLFTRGTRATAVLPDGREKALPEITVRATEYTVGNDAPDAMPGRLPRDSGMTYAVELSVDEAMAIGAQEIRFSQPVVQLVDNFLGFPVGQLVPSGSYDRSGARWVAEPNGRVIAILGESGGRAVLDVDGSGRAADAEALAALGISDDERASLADVYDPGDELWRVPITHFTPYDFNWPQADVPLLLPDPDDDRPDCGAPGAGSFLDVEGQRLAQRIPLVGTDVTLAYRSDRTPGYRQRFVVPVLPEAVARGGSTRGLEGATVRLEVAGTVQERRFDTDVPRHTTFIWDGRDAFGRPSIGRETATIRVRFDWDLSYLQPDPTAARAFGSPGRPVEGTPVNPESEGRVIRLGRRFLVDVERWPEDPDDLGGWGLLGHHRHDPVGARPAAEDPIPAPLAFDGAAIDVLGGRRDGRVGPDVPLSEARVGFGAVDAAIDGEGRFVWLEPYAVYRLDGDRVRRIAGNGRGGASAGDGGPATDATFQLATSLDVARDGTILVIDLCRVRRVTPGGIIETVAGTGSCTIRASGDGGPATQASFDRSRAIAAAPDGSFVFAHGNTLRRVSPDGRIETVAGGREVERCHDVPCDEDENLGRASLGVIGDVTFLPDGTLLFVEGDRRRSAIRRVGLDGRVAVVARDLQSAGRRGLSQPRLAVDAAGRLYVASGGVGGWAGTVGPDGDVALVAGMQRMSLGSMARLPEDDEPADAAPLGSAAIAARGNGDDEGALVVADRGLLFEVAGHRPPPSSESAPTDDSSPDDPDAPAEAVLASDGDTAAVFDGRGRHLRTVVLHGGFDRTGWTYGPNDRVATATDADGNVTTIERDERGRANAIVGPDGARNELRYADDGWLTAVERADGTVVRMNHRPDGLLTRFVQTDGDEKRYSWDDDGRLVETTTARGATQTIERSYEGASSRLVRHDQPGPRGERTFLRTRARSGATGYRVTLPGGGATTLERSAAGVSRLERSNGLRVQTTLDLASAPTGPFPTVERVYRTPAGVRREDRIGWTAQPMDGALGWMRWTVEGTRAGLPFSRTWDAATRSWTVAGGGAPAETVTTLDESGRVIEVATAGLPAIRWAYDEAGRVLRIARDDPRTEVTLVSITYDEGGRVESIRDRDGVARRVLRRDEGGRPTEEELSSGAVVVTDRDDAGRVVSLGVKGAPPVRLSWGPGGTLSRLEMPSGRGTDFRYDDAGALESWTLGDGREGSITRDPATGWAVELDVPEGHARYDRLDDGRLSRVTTELGATVLTHDGPLPTRMSWEGPAAGAVAITWGPGFRRTAETVEVGGTSSTLSFDRGDDGRLHEIGPVTLEPAFASGGRALPGGVRQLALGASETTFSHRRGTWTAETRVGGRPVASNVTREEDGRVVEERWTLGGVTETRRHRYDDAGRLVETQILGGDTWTFGWDDRGRRTSHGSARARVDYDGRLLSEGDDRSWTWNDAGQLTRRTIGGATTVFAYDALDLLRSATLPDGRRVSYVLDGLGRRVARRIDGQLDRGWVLGTGPGPLAELDREGRLRARFVYARRRRVPDAMLVGDRTFLLLTDIRGSVRAVVDAADGRVVQRLSYGPFGRVLEDTNPGFQPFGFAGGLYDPDTGLVRLGIRDVDPRAGRFTTADPAFPATGELTAYAYAGGDPIGQVDPTGLDGTSVFSRQTMLDAYDTGMELATGAGDAVFGGANPLRWKETIDSWRRVEDEIDKVRQRNQFDCTSLYYQSMGDRTKTFDLRNEAMWRPMTGWDLAEVGAEHYFMMASDLNAGQTVLGSTRLYAYGLPLLYGVVKQSVFLRTTVLNTSMLRSIGDPLTDETRAASPPNVLLDLYVSHKAHSEFTANGRCGCR